MKLTATDYRKSKRRIRLKSNAVHKLHLKTLSDICSSKYLPPVVPINEHGNYIWNYSRFIDLDKHGLKIKYYKRLYRGKDNGDLFGFYKKYSNRVVRRYKKELPKGCGYKKCFDYWWVVD